MLPIIALSGLVCALLFVAVLIPKRSRSGQPLGPGRDDPPASMLVQSAPSSPHPSFTAHVDHRTLRQRQIDEDAALLSNEFARYEDERYRGEVRDRAARAFGPPPAAAIPAPAAAPRPTATTA